MINARTLAYQLLLHTDRNLSHPDRLIRTMLERYPHLDERERALFTELVYGVLRWQGRLDWHIDQLSATKPRKILPAIRILLRLGLYQILFLDRIPHHAAVNEAVTLARATQPSHLAGFVNGILRSAIRRGGEWDWPPAERQPAEFLSVTQAHPTWLVRRWLQELGLAETEALCKANNQVAPMVLRINPLKADESMVFTWCQDKGIRAEPSPILPGAIRLTSPRQDIGVSEIHRQGWVQIQDEASQLVGQLVAPRPGEQVLDLCSGFGAKATHLAAIMENRGSIVAVDSSAWKLEQLKENAQRQGMDIIRVVATNILEWNESTRQEFDRVLLDAPCTGLGTLRRNPDIKWRRHPKDPYRFSQLQGQLLHRAAIFVKHGGVLVYATCTLLREENEAVVEQFTAQHPEFLLEEGGTPPLNKASSAMDGRHLKTWPHRHDTDGFFAVRWRRT
ncbi:MAG TPA: 16S rRNA (cytosine(967)-C(5))-methyltransferase RsmB [Syntrophobacteraceae bacterium]|nr:16S rRNA (cytosine(967)-C(5))-methyltransferase RsmB [Syntrophobacteraceae bacterium]